MAGFLRKNLGVLYCVEAASGRLVYEERIPGAGQFYASPVLAGDRLLCVARNGVLFVLAAKPQFELIGRSDAPPTEHL
jgi:outer membrane protein assembly factor BamB